MHLTTTMRTSFYVNQERNYKRFPINLWLSEFIFNWVEFKREKPCKTYSTVNNSENILIYLVTFWITTFNLVYAGLYLLKCKYELIETS